MRSPSGSTASARGDSQEIVRGDRISGLIPGRRRRANEHTEPHLGLRLPEVVSAVVGATRRNSMLPVSQAPANNAVSGLIAAAGTGSSARTLRLPHLGYRKCPLDIKYRHCPSAAGRSSPGELTTSVDVADNAGRATEPAGLDVSNQLISLSAQESAARADNPLCVLNGSPQHPVGAAWCEYFRRDAPSLIERIRLLPSTLQLVLRILVSATLTVLGLVLLFTEATSSGFQRLVGFLLFVAAAKVLFDARSKRDGS